MSICSFLYIFVVCYSTTATTTTPVMVVSSGLSLVSSVDCSSFPGGISGKLGSAWSGSTPPLFPRGSGGFIESASVPQQQPPSLMPLLAYANYAMHSPQVGFFFRVAFHCFVYYMFGVCSGVLGA